MKIAILESLGISEKALADLEKPFVDEGHVFEHYTRTADTDTLCGEVKSADAVILANMPLPAKVIAAGDQLRFIDIAFTGVDHVAMDEARAHGITVSNASGYSNEAVAELALSMALSLARNTVKVEERCRSGKTKDGLVGTEILGKTVGIVGLGKIGTRSAELFHALGARILSASLTVHADAPAYVEQTDLDTVLRESDYVLLHCPLTAQTRGMISAELLKKMKPTAYLLNLARGPVVVSADLAQALKDGTIAGAGIDVFDKEPPLPADEPLLDAPNTLLTPHVAFATKESMILRANIVFGNLRAWMNGNPENLVK